MKLTIVLLTLLLGASVAFAQDPPLPAKVQPTKAAGNYEGTVKGQAEKVSLQVKLEVHNVVGRVLVADKTYEITGGSLSDEDLNLEFKGGRLDAKVNGNTLTGELRIGSEKKQIVLKRVPAMAATAPAPATPPTSDSNVNLNGDWEGMADANGQPFPFLLTLKVEGEKVTGGSSSQLGEASIKEGVWKDGKLSFQLEGQNGTISMSATVVEGKLAGEFDYAGQLQGKWVAVRKN